MHTQRHYNSRDGDHDDDDDDGDDDAFRFPFRLWAFLAAWDSETKTSRHEEQAN